jgi:hypothetical protein
VTEQIKPSVTNPTIADIYQSINGGRLILKPDFQRKFVWTASHQEAFLDTILKGFPFPEIYVCEGGVDTKKLRTTQFVIDGQQRLTTIKRYIDGVSEGFTTVANYSSLSETQREEFLRYQIVVRDIGRVSDETIHEVFRRINLTKFKLDDIEIHNAVYDGQFIQCAKDILEKVSLEEYGVFHESEFTRMADLHFVLLVMATLESGGYFPEDTLVERMISDNNDVYKNRSAMLRRLVKTFRAISELGLANDSIWFRKSNFFTLTVEAARQNGALPIDATARLERLEAKIMTNKHKTDNDYGRYYLYMYSATNQRKARVTRSDLFVKEVLKLRSESFVSKTTKRPRAARRTITKG